MSTGKELYLSLIHICYGGLKQLDGLGPNGETIMDYSIYDAINAGFGKLVLDVYKRQVYWWYSLPTVLLMCSIPIPC